jgi:hypothetical protein
MKRGSLYLSRRLLINTLDFPDDMEIIRASIWDQDDRNSIRLHIHYPNPVDSSIEDGEPIMDDPIIYQKRVLINDLNLPDDTVIRAAVWDSDWDSLRLFVYLPDHVAQSNEDNGIIYLPPGSRFGWVTNE